MQGQPNRGRRIKELTVKRLPGVVSASTVQRCTMPHSARFGRSMPNISRRPDFCVCSLSGSLQSHVACSVIYGKPLYPQKPTFPHELPITCNSTWSQSSSGHIGMQIPCFGCNYEVIIAYLYMGGSLNMMVPFGVP